MAQLSRTTVYLEPGLHRALKIKGAISDQTISELVNEAVRQSLRGNTRSRARRLSREDAADLAIARRRLRQPSRPFEAVIADLKRKGRL